MGAPSARSPPASASNHGTVYYWLKTGLLDHRKAGTGAVCIPFSAKTEAKLRTRRVRSRNPKRTEKTALGDAV